MLLASRSPWDQRDVVARIPAATASDLAEACEAAATALPVWAADAQRRHERLRDFAVLLARQRGEIADLLIREAGKVRRDAEAEADLLVKKIEVTLGPALARTPGFSAAAAEGAATVVWRPRGVAAVLGPYNFPLHLLHGLVIPALTVGCTVVAKPSERCPGLGALYGRLLAEAGLDAFCRVVQGGADVAGALVERPEVATVAAVGSRAMGLALARRLAHRPEVVCALELGGVNPALVLPDAPDDTAAQLADGAWRMAGQRCTATRIVHVPAAQLDHWLTRLRDARSSWLPGADATGATGPLITPELREKFQVPYRALPAGFELIAGSPARPGEQACHADPLLLAVRSHEAWAARLVKEESFGPALVVAPYTEIEQAVARMQANPYRLATSIFTADAALFASLAARLDYGLVNRNRPTAGARSDLPFGGCGLSGNGRPAALAANAIFADETVVWG